MNRRHRDSWLSSVSQGPLDNLEDKRTRILTTAKSVASISPTLGSPSKRSSALQRLILHPESSFIFFWNILLISLIVYQSFAIPFFIFFRVSITGALGCLEFAITLIFLLDICINFSTAVFRGGVFVAEHKAIAREYVQHWFWLDLLSSFPFLWLTGEFLSESTERSETGKDSNRLPALLRLLKALRFLRVLRLIRLAKLKRIFIKVEDYVASSSIATLMLFLRLLFLVFLLAHWTACLWYYVAVMEETAETWVGVLMKMQDYSEFHAYVTALYFTFATMSTVGYGDVHPYSRVEKTFCIFAMVLACAVFAYTVGSISSLLAKSSADATEHRNRVISVNRYMKKQGIPAGMQFRVRRYLEYLWDRQRDSFLMEKEIIAMLSESLKDEIYAHVHGSIVLLCPPFKSFDSMFISKLSQHLNGETFAPSDVIFSQGEATTKMYFIGTGSVNIYHQETGSSFMLLSASDYFGEIAFFLETPRCASAACTDFVDLFSLSREGFHQLSDEFPASAEKVALIRSNCASGDLTTLCVFCYSCTACGHVSARCPKALLDYDHESSRGKWLRAREKKSVYINPHMDPMPNIERVHRPKLRVQYQARNAKGNPRQSIELFERDPELLRLAREFQDTSLAEGMTSRQATFRPEENAGEMGEKRPTRFSIFEGGEDVEPKEQESRRENTFRKSLLRRVPPVEVQTFGAKSSRPSTPLSEISKGNLFSSDFRPKCDDEISELGSDFRPFLSFRESDEVSTSVKDVEVHSHL